MAIVIITANLEQEVNKKFKGDAPDIFELMLSLEENPKKGKLLDHYSGIAIKEIKYKKFRFYFVSDEYKIKFLSVDELKDLIIKFVRMSEKKDQQRVIEDIKHILRNIGEEGF